MLEHLSRWVMYFGIVALLGALIQGYVFSATLALVLILQYAALQFYRGYGAEEPEPQPGDEPS